jgi:hypothetical protein
MEFGCNVDVVEPMVFTKEVFQEFGFELGPKLKELKSEEYEAIILGVAQDEFESIEIRTKYS